MEERDPVLEARLKEQFQGCCFRGAIHAFASCDSTMERAHALARDGAGEGTLVFAARQEQGRGRLGRRWESPAGGAYFSLILKPIRPPAEIPQLSLVAGLAAAETIHEQLTTLAAGPGSRSGRGTAWLAPARLAGAAVFGPRSPRLRRGTVPARPSTAAAPSTVSPPAALPTVSIRWPNDVLVDGKKVAGILTEASSAHDPRSPNHEPRSYVVLGIGINVTTDPRDLPETATSLQAALTPSYPRSTIHDPLDPLALVSALCSKFDGWYDIWTAKGFAPIRAALLPWLTLGGIVRLTVGDSQLEGQATDVDDLGRLLVRLDSGLVRAFEAGEVTLLR